MFRAACELAEESEAKRGVDQMRRTIGCVVMCQATLEAFLNESVERLRALDELKPQSERQWKSVVEAMSGANLELRWLVYPRLRWGKTFDRSAEPFQSFHLLVHLRNALAHYSPRTAEHSAFPSKRIKSLGSLFQFSGPANAMWTIRVLNAACARWSCRATKAMIQEYCRLADGEDPWAPARGVNGSTGALVVVPPFWREPPSEPNASG